MIVTRTPLRQRALKLPARQRMDLAVLLLESLEDQTDDASLLKQLKRRLNELCSAK